MATWGQDTGLRPRDFSGSLCSSQQQEIANSAPSPLHGKKQEETPAVPLAKVLHPCTGTGTSLVRGAVSSIRRALPPADPVPGQAIAVPKGLSRGRCAG